MRPFPDGSVQEQTEKASIASKGWSVRYPDDWDAKESRETWKPVSTAQFHRNRRAPETPVPASASSRFPFWLSAQPPPDGAICQQDPSAMILCFIQPRCRDYKLFRS